MTRIVALCLTIAFTTTLPDLTPGGSTPMAGPCDPAIQKCW
ncbi:MAG: hypothetical protein WBB25_07745 [Sulfitobacter sp.]